MTRRLVGAFVAALLVLAGGGCAPSSPDPATAPVDGPSVGADRWAATDDDDALFTVDCPFSHRASDDPIVLPGQPGTSHSHEFFGSTTTDATSTGETLQGTATTCEDPDDTAAYWTPTLSVDGVPVDPTFLRAYYRARPGVDVRDVTAPPVGLALIAGAPELGSVPATRPDEPDGPSAASAPTTLSAPVDHAAMGHGSTPPPSSPAPPEDASTADAGWGCGLRPRSFSVWPPTDCTDLSPLTLRLRFPDCWDGRNLDSPDHQSHVARSIDGACPSTHPVLMTELQLSIVWPVTGEDAARVTLASGAIPGAHGDFLNGWDPDALEGRVELCIRAKANCTIG